MDMMTDYLKSLSDADLAQLATRNLVAAQNRAVDAEVAARGLTAAPRPVKVWARVA